MPQYFVDSEQTASTSASLVNDFNELEAKLNDVRNKVQNLKDNGYRTPSQEQQFTPAFEQFMTGFTQLNQSLDSLAKFVKQVGDTFDQADQSLRG
jgi:WXG100 family type VII secretion target